MNSTITSSILLSSHGRRSWLLLGLLVVLHLVLWLDVTIPIGRSLLIVHLGLFLLWQPFVGSRLVIPRPYLILFALMLAAMVGFGRWALILWMVLLGGLIGGRVFFNVALRIRLFYLLALTDLVASLLLVAVPAILPGPGYENALLHKLALFGLPLVMVSSMLMLPARDEGRRSTTDSIDLVYSVFIMLLLAVLVAGTIAVMLLRGLGYFEALLVMLVVMATVLLILALVWSPRAGFPGLAALTLRYLLAERMPLDRALRDLTELSREESNPAHFSRQACALVPTYLTWIAGGHWRLDSPPRHMHESFGECRGVEHVFIHGPLQLSVFSQRSMSPTLAWQTRLFVQLIGEFCQAKLQADRLQEMSYLQAVHETGARLTHDVKNLLQSLHTLCAAVEREGSASSPEFQALLRRQLPAITQRLQLTVNKLQQPASMDQQTQSAANWWPVLCQRFEGAGVSMEASAEALRLEVPLALFDSAAENLVQNAFDKRSLTPRLQIHVRLGVEGGQPTLEVEDDGAAVASEFVPALGTGLSKSENGLGIGLYQVGRQAAAVGYQLMLGTNRDGAVCFQLRPFSG